MYLFFILPVVIALRTSLRGDIDLEPIIVPLITADAPPLEMCRDAMGQQTVCDPAATTTTPPPRYAANDESVYQIETVYTNSDDGLVVATTDPNTEPCTYVVGPAGNLICPLGIPEEYIVFQCLSVF